MLFKVSAPGILKFRKFSLDIPIKNILTYKKGCIVVLLGAREQVNKVNNNSVLWSVPNWESEILFHYDCHYYSCVTAVLPL